MKLNTRQRTTLGEKLMDTANLAVGALVFGQFLASVELSFRSVILSVVGIVAWVGFCGLGIALLRDHAPHDGT